LDAAAALLQTVHLWCVHIQGGNPCHLHSSMMGMRTRVCLVRVVCDTHRQVLGGRGITAGVAAEPAPPVPEPAALVQAAHAVKARLPPKNRAQRCWGRPARLCHWRGAACTGEACRSARRCARAQRRQLPASTRGAALSGQYCREEHLPAQTRCALRQAPARNCSSQGSDISDIPTQRNSV